MTGGGNGGRGACAVCKHQRRKCEPNCELATYFPAHRMNDFRALHLVFGVANLTKLIKANASDAARRRAAETLTWEARWRERDPSDGCYREVSCLRRDNAVLRAENAALRRQLAEQQQLLLCWSSACSTTGGALLHSASAINGTPPCGGNGLLTAARPHHAPAAPAAMHTTLAYRGMPVCTTTTANGGGRRPASDATAIAVRGSGGQVDASRDNKSSAR
jgi:hypothetical protein